MTEFVLEQSKGDKWTELSRKYGDLSGNVYARYVRNYANFLTQPLTLGMFVPCDEDGNVLEYPKTLGVYSLLHTDKYIDLFNQIQKAKKRVLFEGFEIQGEDWVTMKNGVGCSVNNLKEMTIEDWVKYNPTLTPTAIKQIGLTT